MGNLPRVLALRPLRYTSFCLIVIFLIIGWCRAAGENGSLSIEDPGSQDRVTRATHPKAPPLPTGEDIPPNTTLYRVVLEQGDWYVYIEDGASDSEVSCSTEEAAVRRILFFLWLCLLLEVYL